MLKIHLPYELIAFQCWWATLDVRLWFGKFIIFFVKPPLLVES